MLLFFYLLYIYTVYNIFVNSRSEWKYCNGVLLLSFATSLSRNTTLIRNSNITSSIASKIPNNTKTVSTSIHQKYIPRSLLFLTPDIHDGTTTDLAASLTSQGHSVYCYNINAAMPPYTKSYIETISEADYLNL